MAKTYNSYKNSGITWVGEIPSDWVVGLVGRYFEEVKNPNINQAETNTLQFKMGDIISKKSGDSKYNPETIEGYNVVEPGTIMINGLNLSFDLISQRVGQVHEKGAITSTYLALAPVNGMKSDYAKYLLKAYDNNKALHSMGRGLRATLSYGTFRTEYVLVPTEEEQTLISDFLDKRCSEIDSLISIQEEMIRELQNYKKSVISESVVRGIRHDTNLKNSGIEWIGNIPENWSVFRVKNLVSSISKGNGITKDEVFEDGETPCVRYGEIYSKYNNSFDNCISYTKRNVLSSCRFFHTGDILCSGTGELVEEIGKSIVYKGDSECLAGGDIIILTPNDNVDPVFMNYALNCHHAQCQKSCSKAKLKVVHISASDIANIKIPVPSLIEQQKIANYLDEKSSQIDSLIAIKRDKILELKDYKKSIIFEYVTGKKRV